MVSVVISLLGVVAIFQILTVWDSGKRTTTAGSDAQIAGTIGIFNLDRDLKLAGYGFGTVPSDILGCTVEALNAASAVANFAFLPMVITQGAGATATTGAGGAPDSIAVLYGNSNFFVDSQRFNTSTTTTKKTRSRIGLMRGDLVVVADNPVAPTPANCALVEVTDNSDPDRLTFGHAAVTYVKENVTPTPAAAAARFNPPSGPAFAFSAGRLFNLGPGPVRNVWQIRTGGVLAWSNTIMATAVQDVAEGIVDLQAQYGTGTPVTWASTTPADWTQLQAVRVAILSRSQQFEKEAVTTAAPQYFGNTFDFNMTNVFGPSSSSTAGDPNNWQHYRYRVYEKVIPLRNVIWGGSL
jgi:type IV pilus assembly protein PilW